MFRTRAHSLIVQSRLAISLAWVAGYVNTAAVLTCGVVTSHVTGHASALGREVAQRAWTDAALMAALIGAFFVGALASGFALEIGRQRGWSSIYVLPATMEIALLSAFAIGVRLHDVGTTEAGGSLWWMTTVAAVAMGVQNATITRISSGVVRTTHLTGIVTDLGHESAQLAVIRRFFGRGMRPAGDAPRGPSWQRIFLLASILGSFILGSACGAWVYLEIPRWSMLAPILLLCWIVVADAMTPICEIEPSMLAEVGARPLPRGVHVHRIMPRGSAAGLGARLPDLAAWVASLGAECRVAVLDLSRVPKFGPLAANELHSMFAAAAAARRLVVVAGVDPIERATLNALTRSDLLSAANCAASVDDGIVLAARLAGVGLEEVEGT